MRVLILDQFSELGGAQRCLLDLMPAVIQAGWDIHAMLPGAGPLVESLRSLGIPVQTIRCGPYSQGRKTLRDVGMFLGDYRALLPAIRRAIENQRPDLIYVNGPRLLPAAARACGTTPILFHAHSFLSQRYAVSLIGHALRKSEATVIASSRFVATPWTKYVDVQTIYNGTSPVAFRPKPAPQGRPWRIGVIGRISPEKGQLEFVRAARATDGAEFHIYGAPLWSSGSYLNILRAAAEGLAVQFHGWTDSVDTILHYLDLVAVPSPSHESTTRVILEAFSAGTPVVAFPSGGIPEVVDHGRTGFLTTSVSAAALAEQIRGLINQPDVLPDVIASARDEWNRRFTLDRYTAEVMESMDRAARRNNSGNDTAAARMTAAATPSTGP